MSQTLYDVLTRRGGLSIRMADLDGALGFTEFRSQTVYLATGMTVAELRSTLVHELVHLLRGPVPRRLVGTEEVAVQHQTARILVPDGAELAEQRRWTEDDLQELAARYRVDRDVIETALNPPTIPWPRPESP
ncbi:ImmA/IrrE family metallo-endopeptidase [Pseudonocardia hispaniensis]|uniref:ImmA/IrrE family metallo-endopeptidase n=1 Tax=Pseudonocardia hispaniensis TaxID=904933 RepID=A0ABW1IYL4_9PSEU